VPFSLLTKTLDRATGYFELGMAEEALAELDGLPADLQQHADVLEMRAVVSQNLGRWNAAAAAYEALCAQPVADTDRFVEWACCLYELGRIHECRAALRAAPAEHIRHPLWHYHLASYEAILGDVSAAKSLLAEALRLEPKLRRMAEHNENLAPLLDGLPIDASHGRSV
jgi:predicted Zn-dependent protease